MSPCNGLFFYPKKKTTSKQTNKLQIKKESSQLVYRTDWLDYQVKVVKIDRL